MQNIKIMTAPKNRISWTAVEDEGAHQEGPIVISRITTWHSSMASENSLPVKMGRPRVSNTRAETLELVRWEILRWQILKQETETTTAKAEDSERAHSNLRIWEQLELDTSATEDSGTGAGAYTILRIQKLTGYKETRIQRVQDVSEQETRCDQEQSGNWRLWRWSIYTQAWLLERSSRWA